MHRLTAVILGGALALLMGACGGSPVTAADSGRAAEDGARGPKDASADASIPSSDAALLADAGGSDAASPSDDAAPPADAGLDAGVSVDSGSPPDAAPGAPSDPPLRIFVTRPGGDDELVTALGSIVVAGFATGPVARVGYWLTGGPHGVATGTTAWSIPDLPLGYGDNLLTVTASAAGGSARTTINLRRTHVQYRARPAIAPDVVFTGQSTQVGVSLPISTAGTAQVELRRYAPDGSSISLGPLFDDGNAMHGDQFANDGVYSALVGISESTPGTLVFRAVSTSSVGTLDRSAPARLYVVPRPSADEIAHMKQAARTGHATFQARSAAVGSAAAAAEVATMLAADAAVLSATVAGSGVSVVFRTGIVAALNFNPAGTKGGPPTLGTRGPSSVPRLFQTGDATYASRIGNQRAFLFSPFVHGSMGFGNADDNPRLEPILRAAQCPLTIEGTYLDSDADLERLASMAGAGVVSISAHGDTFSAHLDRGEPSHWAYAFGSERRRALELIWFREPQMPDPLDRDDVLKLLLSLRLVFDVNHDDFFGPDEYTWLAFTPHYVEALGDFPSSIVYLGSCRSFRTGSMAGAFLRRGAGAVFGYTNYVGSVFAQMRSSELFTCLGTAGANSGGCYRPATDAPPNRARWVRGGADVQLCAGPDDDRCSGVWAACGKAPPHGNQGPALEERSQCYQGYFSTPAGCNGTCCLCLLWDFQGAC